MDFAIGCIFSDENLQVDKEIPEVEEQIEKIDIDPISKSAIIFVRRWVLSENLKANQKQQIKRIPEHIKKLLIVMFHTGIVNPRLKIMLTKCMKNF
ncbi:7836_t:CDS:2 [Funneliformis geosporum]|uniref:16898_t:CDS:1 n=1 Tax=Funneliformis geosporum TaxID=1117311 RepID=A0A9W4WPD6_9GLOM|nr:7836_t:CDS:2 [Funneliformis geosporum]CAI2177054.1 16898_t:CDS:2 [Funneliformis geosporum]